MDMIKQTMFMHFHVRVTLGGLLFSPQGHALRNGASLVMPHNQSGSRVSLQTPGKGAARENPLFYEGRSEDIVCGQWLSRPGTS